MDGAIPYAASSSLACRRTGLDEEDVVEAPDVLAEVEEKLRRRGVSSDSTLPPIAESGSRILRASGSGRGLGGWTSSGLSAVS